MENLAIYGRLSTTPQEARKTIRGGRLNGFTDINPMWRVKKLTEVFGPCGLGWYIDIVETRLEPAGDEVKAFAKVNLYWKTEDGWSAPVQGLGGSSFVAKERNGPYVSDECYKMAVTDAIGSACKLLGMSADIFYEADRTKYTVDPEDEGEGRVTAYDELMSLTSPNERDALVERYGPLQRLQQEDLDKLIIKIRKRRNEE